MKVEVESFGCRLNHAEAERIGYTLRQGSEHSREHVVVVNSCAVTNEAERQLRQRLRRLRRTHPEARIFVTGCASETDWSFYSEMSAVDGVVSNDQKFDREAYKATGRKSLPPARSSLPMSAPPVPETAMRTRFFMPVQQGCDYHCTFCIIPHARGQSRSLDAEACCETARKARGMGVKEIVLTGVDLASWRGGRGRLGELVAAILHSVPDLPRLRLSSLDGAAIDERLLSLIGSEERLMPHIHLSLQSGDDMILKRMRRRHSRSSALSLCLRLRRLRPEIALGADFIAGFPTETEVMFENTCRFIEEAGLDFLHVFPFSPRRLTPASRMPQLPREVVRARARRLRIQALAAQRKFLGSKLGRREWFLVEKPDAAALLGRCRHNVRTELRCPEGAEPPTQGDLVEGVIVNSDRPLTQVALLCLD